jgi:phosphopantothenoylcysteine decarboxylase/phosphopantothenate--cysteine ligase
MEEPENILRAVNTIFLAKTPAELTGKNILVSAGPTYESIDPVRYIGNYSSGKMGYALAEELAARGAAVTLVSGPVSIKPVHPGIKLIKVQSAQQMYESCVSIFTAMDAAILAAAVADFTPVATSDQKIKREKEILSLQLKPTEDIAARLGELKKSNQVLVGFALETSNEMQHAQNKLARKNFDFIVLDSLQDEGAGFQVDTNKITIIDKDHEVDPYPIKPKTLVAKDIVDKLVVVLHNKLSEK